MKSFETWPELPLTEWQDTLDTLQLWTQVVGKIMLAGCAPVNHFWHAALRVTSRGLGTGPMFAGNRSFEIDFDFVAHELSIATSDGDRRAFALDAYSVAEFYRKLMAALAGLGIEVAMWPMPQELANPIRFDVDETHASYDPEYAHRCWRLLVQADRVCRQFRSGFLGKVSPVHFFWGSFDLALSRFSGRLAPEHPGGGPLATWVTRESYSHEVSSCGWWPGAGLGYPAFYSYAYPQPAGFAEAKIEPASAFYAKELGEWILPYDAVRTAADPDAELLRFFETTYVAAAELGGWDRKGLERG